MKSVATIATKNIFNTCHTPGQVGPDKFKKKKEK